MLYELDGHSPQVHPDAWIAPGCHLIGKVVVKAGASVWFGTTIRGDNETITIGVGSNVQENCVLHTDIGFPLRIGSFCTIGHSAILHGCIICTKSLVGMGATVLNGAMIGAGSLVGANALVTEGKIIQPGSMVMGAPAKVIRELDAAAIAGLEASAYHYRENAARFRASLKPIGEHG
jgi:carbonic anhydrase/acetyltransferase-like protein (isoleucine patch superfamily)